jgi:serine/threonine protein phosphatase 1
VAEGRVLAIGDVHGCVDELRRLLDAAAPAAGDTVVFVGDYLDRGPDVRGVIDLLLEWRARTPARTVFLRGNHEDMALDYLGRDGRWGDAWLRNGGGATLRSYGLDAAASPAKAAGAIPASHMAFLDELVFTHEQAGHLFVHAGIRPGVPLAEQDPEDLVWIREEFFDHAHDLGATVVFGHTPHRRVLVDLPYKIGIDTGCVYGGALTCLVEPDARVLQVRLGDDVVREDSLTAASRRRA